MINNLKEKLSKLGYSKSMIRSCINGTRKPNAEVRYKLRYYIPFDAWGRNLKDFLKEKSKNKRSKK